jgi:uncharacterized protein HemX
MSKVTRKRKAVQENVAQTFDATGSIFGKYFVQQIKESIREDLQILYQKQVDEFHQINEKLNHLQQQVDNLTLSISSKESTMRTDIPKRVQESVFQSYLT